MADDETIVSTDQPAIEPVQTTEPVPQEQPPADTKPPSGDPLSFLNDRVTAARAKLQEGHSDLFPGATEPQPEPEKPAESAPSPEPEAPAPAPAVQTPPATPVTPTPTPVAAQPPLAPKEDIDWREIRRLKKLDKRIRELGIDVDGTRPTPATAASPQPPVQPAPTTEDDPFGVNGLNRRMETEAERISRIEQQQLADRRQAILDNQARQFETTTPDYIPALNYLVEAKKNEYRTTNVGWNEGAQLMANPQWHPAIEKAQDILSERENRYVSEEEAAMELAVEMRVNRDAEALIAGTLSRNGQVPAVVYGLAKQYGYQAAAGAPAAVPVAPAPNGTAAAAAPAPSAVAEKIRQQAKVTAATKSLSNVAGATATPGNAPAPIKSLQDLAAFRARVTPEEYAGYIRQRNDENPRWYHNLGTS